MVRLCSLRNCYFNIDIVMSRSHPACFSCHSPCPLSSQLRAKVWAGDQGGLWQGPGQDSQVRGCPRLCLRASLHLPPHQERGSWHQVCGRNLSEMLQSAKSGIIPLNFDRFLSIAFPPYFYFRLFLKFPLRRVVMFLMRCARMWPSKCQQQPAVTTRARDSKRTRWIFKSDWKQCSNSHSPSFIFPHHSQQL